MWHKEVTSHSIAKSSTHFGHLHQPVLDLLMIAPIQVQCIFPIPFWSILKWNHRHLIHTLSEEIDSPPQIRQAKDQPTMALVAG